MKQQTRINNLTGLAIDYIKAAALYETLLLTPDIPLIRKKQAKNVLEEKYNLIKRYSKTL